MEGRRGGEEGGGGPHEQDWGQAAALWIDRSYQHLCRLVLQEWVEPPASKSILLNFAHPELATGNDLASSVAICKVLTFAQHDLSMEMPSCMIFSPNFGHTGATSGVGRGGSGYV